MNLQGTLLRTLRQGLCFCGGQIQGPTMALWISKQPQRLGGNMMDKMQI